MEPWKLDPARDSGLTLRDRMQSTRREPGLIEKTGHRAWSHGVRTYLRTWHGLRVSGRDHFPLDGPCVIIGNHCSHLDALILACAVPRVLRRDLFSIAAGDVFFDTPSRTIFATHAVNALPMRRRNMGAHALDDLRSRLSNDACRFIIFPEGRRSTDGKLLDFKGGTGMLVAGTDVPVVPCAITGAFEAWPRDKRFPRFRRIEVRVGSPVSFEDSPNDRKGWAQVAAVLRERVEKLVENAVRA